MEPDRPQNMNVRSLTCRVLMVLKSLCEMM